jgi:flavin-dependent dehydrogenase
LCREAKAAADEKVQVSIPGEIVDNLVIGGGLAGSMVAIRLAAAGRQVTLVEKERSAHHKVCGEFLSHEAIEYLHQVGVNPLDLGAATIRTLRLSSRREVIETALPFRALSLSRYALDAAMLSCAEKRGCTVLRGLFVDQLTTHGNQWFAKFRNGESLSARTVFLANGKHDLREWDRTPTGQRDLVAFKLHWQLERSQTEALRELIEIFLFSGGYGGLSLVEGDVANLCLVVRRAELRRIGGWTELFASVLGDNRNIQERMRGAKAMWDRPLAIFSIPYGYLAGRSFGLWCVGDQAAVIPSFTGDGMSIALHSAALATEMYLAGESADQYYRRLHAQLSRGMSFAALLSRLMVTGVGRRMAPIGLSLFPNAMRRIALSTRIPKQAFLADSTLLPKKQPGPQ